MPLIPSGTAGTVSDCDIILQNIFGQASTSGSGGPYSGTIRTYSFLDSGYPAFSMFGFVHGISTLTQRALWACFVSRATFNFNGLFMTVDLEGFAGYEIDSTGFSVFDTQAKAGLTTYPTEPSSPTTVGAPIAGFGNGYTCTIDAQTIELKVRALSLTIETGYVPVADVYGSPYLVAAVGDARRISLNLGDALDDDSAALNDLKTKADTDNVSINASIVAGNTAGNSFQFNINTVQLNAFDLRDNGPTVAFTLPTSYAHASAPGLTDDFTLVSC